jgi:hypothetical protein
MIRTMGKVFLNGTQFTTDPRVRRAWTPRRSRLLGIMGSTTQQDFGRWAKDMRLTLTSGGNFINQSFKNYVDGLMIPRLAAYPYTDYQGVDADVVIVDFDATPTFYRDGRGVLYEYTLVLDVVVLRKLDFLAYSGS